MGNLLRRPVTTVEIDDGETNMAASDLVKQPNLRFGAASMQGWRQDMQDAHTMLLELPNNRNMSFFAVYDGHGGKEVSMFCARYMHQRLEAQSSFQCDVHGHRDIVGSMYQTFLDVDEHLLTDGGRRELLRLRDLPAGSILDGGDQQPTIPDAAADSAEPPAVPLPSGGTDSPDTKTSETTATTTTTSTTLPIAIPTANGSSTDPNDDNAAGKRKRVASASDTTDKTQHERGQAARSDTSSSSSSASASAGTDTSTTGTSASSDTVYVPLKDGLPCGPSSSSKGDQEEDSSYTPEFVSMNCGATAVSVLLERVDASTMKIYTCNAGDSRAVLCRGGKAVDMSRDHAPNLACERKRIEAAGGYINAEMRICGNLNLSRAIGDHRYKGNQDIPLKDQIITSAPEVWETTLKKGDEFLLIACDGIWNVMDGTTAINFVRTMLNASDNVKVSDVTTALVNACLAEDIYMDAGTDNMTALVVVLPQLWKEEEGEKEVAKADTTTTVAEGAVAGAGAVAATSTESGQDSSENGSANGIVKTTSSSASVGSTGTQLIDEMDQDDCEEELIRRHFMR